MLFKYMCHVNLWVRECDQDHLCMCLPAPSWVLLYFFSSHRALTPCSRATSSHMFTVLCRSLLQASLCSQLCLQHMGKGLQLNCASRQFPGCSFSASLMSTRQRTLSADWRWETSCLPSCVFSHGCEPLCILWFVTTNTHLNTQMIMIDHSHDKKEYSYEGHRDKAFSNSCPMTFSIEKLSLSAPNSLVFPSGHH